MFKSVVIYFDDTVARLLDEFVAARWASLLGWRPRKRRGEGNEPSELNLQGTVQAEEMRRNVFATDAVQ